MLDRDLFIETLKQAGISARGAGLTQFPCPGQLYSDHCLGTPLIKAHPILGATSVISIFDSILFRIKSFNTFIKSTMCEVLLSNIVFAQRILRRPYVKSNHNPFIHRAPPALYVYSETN